MTVPLTKETAREVLALVDDGLTRVDVVEFVRACVEAFPEKEEIDTMISKTLDQKCAARRVLKAAHGITRYLRFDFSTGTYQVGPAVAKEFTQLVHGIGQDLNVWHYGHPDPDGARQELAEEETDRLLAEGVRQVAEEFEALHRPNTVVADELGGES